MAPGRRFLRSGDAAFLAFVAATALVCVESYSLSSVFGNNLGLRSQTSAFCQGPTCLKPAAAAAPSLRARTHEGTPRRTQFILSFCAREQHEQRCDGCGHTYNLCV